ncbi:MAG: polysaccharide biosynthesis protein [Firmicutes bacterium]|nr:polysaccharide biosynthesis protein [Bacillota bacterium]
MIKKDKKNKAWVQRFFSGAGMLALCGIIAKMIGAMYKIPLTGILRAEGMGLYQLVFPFYVVLLTISSGGLPVAISKIVSERMADNDKKGATRVLWAAFFSLSIIGSLGSLIMLLFRNQIAAAQGNYLAAIAYVGIAPSVLIVALISCFRGYFQGRQNMLPTAVSQLIEQGIKLIAGMVGATYMMRYGLEWAVFGALVGVSLSELVALLFLVVAYYVVQKRRKNKEKQSNANGNEDLLYARSMLTEAASEVEPVLPTAPVSSPKTFSAAQIYKRIYAVAIPVTLGALVIPITQVIDSLLIINLLTHSGQTIREATSAYGLLAGPVSALVNMPAVLSMSIAMALLPRISRLVAQKKDVSQATTKAFKYSMLSGAPFFALFVALGTPILRLLFRNALNPDMVELGGFLLCFAGAYVIFVSFLQPAAAVLQGVGKAYVPVVNLFIGAAVKALGTVILLPIIGILGAVLATLMCYMVTAFLDTIAIRRYVKNSKGLLAAFLLPVTGSILAAVVTKLAFWLADGHMPSIIALGVAGLSGIIVYLGFLLIVRYIRWDEWRRI